MSNKLQVSLTLAGLVWIIYWILLWSVFGVKSFRSVARFFCLAGALTAAISAAACVIAWSAGKIMGL